MIKAVIFDLDGLLVDTEQLWLRARSELFLAHRLEWTEADQIKCMGVSTSFWASLMDDRSSCHKQESFREGVVYEMEHSTGYSVSCKDSKCEENIAHLTH